MRRVPCDSRRLAARMLAGLESAVLLMAVLSCGPAVRFPKIDRRPPPADYSAWDADDPLESIPAYDAGVPSAFRVDLRSRELRHIDASDAASGLARADFDSRTRWPDAARLPPLFDPGRIMETGKDPGLGLRAVHASGITGKGVGVAIIDSELLVDHVEYAERLRLYEELPVSSFEAQMHGSATASIAVGHSVGVAPEADLYYLAASLGDGERNDFTHYVEALDRIVAVNRALPRGRKIRVVSISVGWEAGDPGFDEMVAAVARAERAGLFVVSSNSSLGPSLPFSGLDRDPLGNPDDPAVYGPGAFLAAAFSGPRDPRRDAWFLGRLWVPMDSRSLASPTGRDEYVFYREGGLSWAIPWVAGLYALACQVDPDLAPEEFCELASRTGRMAGIAVGDETRPLGPIVDPGKLLSELAKAGK